ncbi:anaphase-promoting complex subunit Cut9 [Malassezia vespertilionis]|uniref:Cdc16p n=1 Tax=Malassezia vespertilionis TaxID=2020962 RepID=A0A2N1JD94_9BASI|nr:anaphase-promoting complex subunit Cut9 [Malassezia vespertilionis]PKI84531.1 Cdc16p [Malassezia vespertilionis]WFD06405.1 anaphase-promoting complex subunit Cut9 [Malassezia vespertilionis]
MDTSTSIARQDEDASNSGLLDLGPMLSPIKGASSTRRQGLYTPILGPQEEAPMLEPPPLLGKGKRIPRRSSEGAWAGPNSPPPAQRTASTDSNRSVIIHEENVTGEWGRPEVPSPSNSAQPATAASTHARLPARMRRWMHDAMKQHMYETAIFWGKLVVALEPTEIAYNDVYWLAQAYFLTHQYARAEQLLTTPLRRGAADHAALPTDALPNGLPDALYDAVESTRAHSILPQSIRVRSGRAGVYGGVESSDGHEARETSKEDDEVVEMLGVPGEAARRRKRPPSSSPERSQDPFCPKSRPSSTFAHVDEEIQRIVHAQERTEEFGPCMVNWSAPCRYLAAQSQVRLGKLYEALELTGEDHTRWTSGGKASVKTPALDGGLKLGSSVCHLRGQIYLRLDQVAKAKEAFMLALALDVKNYDSFTALIDGNLLGAEEQWDFVQALEFAAQAGTEKGAADDFEVVRLLYTTRLAKQSEEHIRRAAHARQLLCATPLRASPDVLLGLAEELYACLRYQDAYTVTSYTLQLDPAYALCLPIHIACAYYLPQLRPALFLLAHKLTDSNPESAEAWYAVGVWYASAARWQEARRYFSKSSLLDPRFAPSWIAFGHSFSLEGESDQAITAYSTAARKFQSSGLPRLFIGMEHLQQGNKNLALIFLNSSAAELGDDPLCANERGVAAFHNGQYTQAIALFQAALAVAADTQQPAAAWVSVHLNLGLALRRVRRDDEARARFLRVIECDTSCAPAYIALGMCAHRQGDLADAIGWYHEGLGIDPRDAIGTELLTIALEMRVAQGLPAGLLDHSHEETSEMWEAAVRQGEELYEHEADVHVDAMCETGSLCT